MTDEVLRELIFEARARRHAGEPVDVVKLCREHPELVETIRGTLGLAGDSPGGVSPGGGSLANDLPGGDSRTHSPPASKTADPLLGTTLGDRFELVATLGSGGMGTVYEARDLTLGRGVAVKVLRVEALGSEAGRVRFEREAQVLASLQHENLVSVFDQGRAGGGVEYLVMELLDGVSMSAFAEAAEGCARNQALPDARAVRDALNIDGPDERYVPMVVGWVAALASGLSQSHAAGVYHRDVKPSNVLVRRDGRPVLLDFGIAARLGDRTITVGGAAIGTPWYMAPEQADGSGTSGPQFDVYGLCATLYHLMTFRPPHVGTLMEVLHSLRHREPPPPHRLNPELPRDLCSILEKGLARDPRHRYGTMAGLESDLRAFLEFRPVAARPVSGLTRMVKFLRRRPGLVVGAVLMFVASTLGVVLAQDLAAGRSERAARFGELKRTLPLLLCFEATPGHPLATTIREREGAVALLSEMLELRPSDLHARLLRATLYLDAGDRAASLADLEVLEKSSPTPVFAALKEAYRTAENSQSGVTMVELDGLPRPATELDHFLHGFLLFRARKFGVAVGHLRQAKSFPPARDLELMIRIAMNKKNPSALRELRDEVIRIEGDYGHDTALTNHLVGAIQIFLEDYTGALKPLERSLELRPDRHGPLNNLGLACVRLGFYERGLKALQRAHELRPWTTNAKQTMLQAHRDQWEFEQADRVLTELIEIGLGEYAIAYERGRTASERSFHALIHGQHQDRKRFAEQALKHFRSCAEMRRDARLESTMGYVTLLRDNSTEAMRSFLVRVAKDPLRASALKNVAHALSPENTPELAGEIKELLARIACGLTPGHTAGADVAGLNSSVDKK